MDGQKKSFINDPLPVWTLSMVSVSIALTWVPALSRLFLYDREAILGGQIWRFLTAHGVHFSAAHLCYNLFAFILASWLLEADMGRGVVRLSLIIAASIGCTLIIVRPGMAYFGGLSGLSCGLWTYLAFCGLRKGGPWRLACGVALVALFLKIVAESQTGQSLFWYPSTVVVPVWESHAAGCFSAFGLFLFQRPAITHKS